METMNVNFRKDWEYPKEFRKVKKAVFNYLRKNSLTYSTGAIKRAKAKPRYMEELDNLLGLPYTSTSSFAGLWVTNVELHANNTHNIIGFAINELSEVIAIADDYEENSIYIKL